MEREEDASMRRDEMKSILSVLKSILELLNFSRLVIDRKIYDVCLYFSGSQVTCLIFASLCRANISLSSQFSGIR